MQISMMIYDVNIYIYIVMLDPQVADSSWGYYTYVYKTGKWQVYEKYSFIR